jgi:uncharacterized FAD-dependent dehydrogenase
LRTRAGCEYHFVAQAKTDVKSRPVVIGMGPAGLFAALIWRSRAFVRWCWSVARQVRAHQNTFALWRQGVLNRNQRTVRRGWRGHVSDGKLYSQIKDPKHHGRKVLTEFVKAGAPPKSSMLAAAHRHLPPVGMVGMRARIEALGGEIRFASRVDDFDIDDGRVRGVMLASGEHIAADHIILAIGHSARDTFQKLHECGVYIEPKPFSIGFRIEHPQSLIDTCRFGDNAGDPLLGAADYKLVHHASNGRSVYSFCMCPGGTVVAATSEEGRVVTNGMSQYSRNERNANSGIVVGITPEDFPGDVLAGVEFQRKWEARAFELGGRNYRAPGQRVGDFLAGRPSTSIGEVSPSYTPGVTPTDLSTALPDYAIAAIREALPEFDKQIKGFAMDDAVLTGVETRTSSPIRVKRGEDFQSINIKGLYPAGEGAGYAGGILSAAVDGIEVAESVGLDMVKNRK